VPICGCRCCAPEQRQLRWRLSLPAGGVGRGIPVPPRRRLCR